VKWHSALGRRSPRLLDLSPLSLTDAGLIWTAVGLGAGGRIIAGHARGGATARVNGSRILSGEQVGEGREAPQGSFTFRRIRTAAGGGIDPVIGPGGAVTI
jgi:hypothetical protein